MSRIFLMIMTLATIVTAQAAQPSGQITLLVCKSRQAKMDAGYVLKVSLVDKKLEAALGEMKIYGSVEIQTYKNVTLEASRRPGAGQRYSTQDFSLSLPVVAPVNGIRFARLKAQSKGRTIQDEMLCARTR